MGNLTWNCDHNDRHGHNQDVKELFRLRCRTVCVSRKTNEKSNKKGEEQNNGGTSNKS
jgi:hypothetical protein